MSEKLTKIYIWTRIHVKTLFGNKDIYGVLNFNITSFENTVIKKCEFTKKEMKCLVFGTKNYGFVYCSRHMAIRIKERLDITGFLEESKIIEFGLKNS